MIAEPSCVNPHSVGLEALRSSSFRPPARWRASASASRFVLRFQFVRSANMDWIVDLMHWTNRIRIPRQLFYHAVKVIIAQTVDPGPGGMVRRINIILFLRPGAVGELAGYEVLHSLAHLRIVLKSSGFQAVQRFANHFRIFICYRPIEF